MFDADGSNRKTLSDSIGGYAFSRLPQIFWRFFCGIYCTCVHVCTCVRVCVCMRVRVRATTY
jgi:uncharacterized membrane protein YccF (DUF307 family)